MKKYVIVALVFSILGFCQSGRGQCPSGDVILTTQAEVDSFKVLYPNCTEISSDISLVGNNIVQLNGLSNLDSVSSITIQNTGLENFQGLTRLKIIKGNFIAENNVNLTSFIGLSNLISINGTLLVKSNSSLLSFEGLESLYGIGYGLDVQFNGIKSLEGLSNVKNIGAFLYVMYEDSLLNFQGLNNLENVWGEVHIRGNGNLDGFTGLDKLKLIQEELLVESNNIKSTLGLASLEEIGFDLILTNNKELDSLIDFPSLAKVARRITVEGNDDLKYIGGFNLVVSELDRIVINSNPKLEVVKGFNSIPKIYDMFIKRNDSLTEFSGFNGLVSFHDLNIQDNKGFFSFDGFNSVDTLNRIFCDDNNIISLTGFEEVTAILADFRLESNDSILLMPRFQKLISAGNLYIYNNFNLQEIPEFVNLRQLLNYSGITISFNHSIKKIYGFQALSTMNGSLGVVNNLKLESFNGFDSLKEMDRGVYFYSNWVLKTISGFSLLDTITDRYTIRLCPKLDSIKGFQNLKFVSDFELSYDSSLVFTNFKNLERVYDLLIRDCKRLKDIDFLQKISGARDVQIIGNDSILNLFGLKYIQAASNLEIKDNLNLNSISSLSSLRIIYDNLEIINNPKISSLDGLQNLRQVEWVVIEGQPLLSNLIGLGNAALSPNIRSIYIRNNDSLEDLTGLENFPSSPMLSLYITDNQNMKSLNGFCTTPIITIKSITIERNPSLVDLSKLKNLESINYNFRFNENDSIYDFSDLSSLSTINSSVEIIGNSRLAVCSNIAICSKISSDPDMVTISGNASGCISVNEVVNGCGSIFNTLSGKVYVDLDCNETFNPTIDISKSYHLVRNDDTGRPQFFTDNNAQYVGLIKKNDELHLSVDQIQYFSRYPEIHTIETDSVLKNFTNIDFRYCPDSLFHNIALTATSFTIPRPGFVHTYQICVENLGVYTESAQITLNFHSSISQYIEIVDADGGIVNGQTITWDVHDIQIFETKCLNLQVRLSPSTPLGTHIRLSGSVMPVPFVSETDLDDNVIRLSQIVVGSYDPNNKTTESHKFTLTQQDSIGHLDYTIRFQNTGNYPAEFVEVYDTLESNLDIRTLKMIAASHRYTLEFPSENVLKWRFDDINLADSASNEAASHGFIRFSISTKANLPLYTAVQNAVSIYFDYNEPILTDTSVVTACPPLNVGLFAVQAHCGEANGIGIAQAQSSGIHSYDWSNGMTGAEIHDVAPGAYAVTVTGDVAACSTVGFLMIGEIPPPIIEVAGIDSLLCFGEKGSIDIDVTDGSLPYEFEWSNGETDEDLLNLDAGTYQLFFEDAEGCTDSSLVVTITESDKIIIGGQIINTNSSVNPNGAIMPTISGGSPPFNFLWSTGDTTLNLNGIPAGNYTLTATDMNGCEHIHSFTVNLVVSADKIEEQSNIYIFPNPTSGLLNVHFSEKNEEGIRLKLSDISGKLVLEIEEMKGKELALEVSGFAAGFYFLEIEYANGNRGIFQVTLVE